MGSSEVIMETPGSHVPKTRVLLAKMTVVIILAVFFVHNIGGERVHGRGRVRETEKRRGTARYKLFNGIYIKV